MGILGLKIHLETKLKEELSHGSKAQASFLPFFPPSSCLARLPSLPGNLPQSHHRQEKNP